MAGVYTVATCRAWASEIAGPAIDSGVRRVSRRLGRWLHPRASGPEMASAPVARRTFRRTLCPRDALALWTEVGLVVASGVASLYQSLADVKSWLLVRLPHCDFDAAVRAWEQACLEADFDTRPATIAPSAGGTGSGARLPLQVTAPASHRRLTVAALPLAKRRREDTMDSTLEAVWTVYLDVGEAGLR